MEEFKPGMNVIHPLFGPGTIRAVSGSGPQAKLSVDFPAAGPKKLIAGAANLRIAGSSGSSAHASSPPARAEWFETLDASARPLKDLRLLESRIHEQIKSAVHETRFWLVVRERMRQSGAAPRVLDEPSGNISVTVRGLLQMHIVVRHREMIRRDQAHLAQAMWDVLAREMLSDFSGFSANVNVSVDGSLLEPDIIQIDDADIGPLPDRAPKTRPRPDVRRPATGTQRRERDD